jgi:hypothetical protein
VTVRFPIFKAQVLWCDLTVGPTDRPERGKKKKKMNGKEKKKEKKRKKEKKKSKIKALLSPWGK